MNPPVLSWHREAANDITPHAWDWDDVDIAAIIAAHDPHAAQQEVAQHEATVRLLREALPYIADAAFVQFTPGTKELRDEIRAHLAALREKGTP